MCKMRSVCESPHLPHSPRSVLTLADLAPLLDIPAVQGSSLLVFHGRAFVEVLREVGLVQTRGLHHLSLGEVVLLHVGFHLFRHVPGILSAIRRQVGDTSTHARAVDLQVKLFESRSRLSANE